MAFATTESFCFDISAGPSSLKLLIGNYTNTGGSTGGTIIPGTPSSGSAASGSTGIRKMVGSGWFTSTSTSPSDVKSVKSYDSATYDRDILTITTAADQTGEYFILGQDAGA